MDDLVVDLPKQNLKIIHKLHRMIHLHICDRLEDVVDLIVEELLHGEVHGFQLNKCSCILIVRLQPPKHHIQIVSE